MTIECHPRSPCHSRPLPSSHLQRVAASYLREPYAHVAVGRVGSSLDAISQVRIADG